MKINLKEHNQIVLDFFSDNSDFFELFENVVPGIDYVEKTFTSCPNTGLKHNISNTEIFDIFIMTIYIFNVGYKKEKRKWKIRAKFDE